MVNLFDSLLSSSSANQAVGPGKWASLVGVKVAPRDAIQVQINTAYKLLSASQKQADIYRQTHPGYTTKDPAYRKILDQQKAISKQIHDLSVKAGYAKPLLSGWQEGQEDGHPRSWDRDKDRHPRRLDRRQGWRRNRHPQIG